MFFLKLRDPYRCQQTDSRRERKVVCSKKRKTKTRSFNRRQHKRQIHSSQRTNPRASHNIYNTWSETYR